jgi:hypothetical protein
MDITKTLEEIRQHKQSVERAIASLEELQRMTNGSTSGKRRGRKAMSEDERQEVSKRMKIYWSKRRRQ